MATVGIVGGLGPESTIDYYRRIIKAWQQEDPATSPSLVIDSLDAQRALQLVASDRQALTDYLLASIERLSSAGAGFAVLSANTAHVVFDDLAARARIPLVSIVETCAAEAQRLGLRRAGLLGTRFTMEERFYPAVFGRAGIDVVTPNAGERAWVHDRYVNELLKGDFRDATRQQFIALVDRLQRDEPIDGVVLGGTELPLLLQGDTIAGVRVLDTTALHVGAIVARLRQGL